MDLEALGVIAANLHKWLRRGCAQRRHATGLGPGVPVIDDAPGRQPEGIARVGFFDRRHVVRRLDDRPALGIIRPVLLRRDLGPGHQIMPVKLAVIRGCIENAVGVQPRGAPRRAIGTRPLNARRPVELFIRQARVVARTAS